MALGLVLALAALLSQQENVSELGDIHQQALENPNLFEGDMIIIHNDGLRNAIADENYRWPDATVPYVIDKSLNGRKSVINDAIAHYHDKTCVKFVERKSEKEYVKFFKGKGCFAAVGRNKTYPQPQPLSLGDGCYKLGTVIHELGHVLGFFHEHSRSDRDTYLNIYLDNVRQGSTHNFRKLKESENILYNDFDYESIMIYGDYAFSKRPNVLKTMEAKNGTPLKNPYDKSSMTESDIERVNKMYNCPSQ